MILSLTVSSSTNKTCDFIIHTFLFSLSSSIIPGVLDVVIFCKLIQNPTLILHVYFKGCTFFNFSLFFFMSSSKYLYFYFCSVFPYIVLVTCHYPGSSQEKFYGLLFFPYSLCLSHWLEILGISKTVILTEV